MWLLAENLCVVRVVSMCVCGSPWRMGLLVVFIAPELNKVSRTECSNCTQLQDVTLAPSAAATNAPRLAPRLNSAENNIEHVNTDSISNHNTNSSSSSSSRSTATPQPARPTLTNYLAHTQRVNAKLVPPDAPTLFPTPPASPVLQRKIEGWIDGCVFLFESLCMGLCRVFVLVKFVFCVGFARKV